MIPEKFYSYLTTEQKELLSLNFLLSEKFIVDYHVSSLNIKGTEIRANSKFHHNRLFFCMLFYKHISRYVDDIEQYEIEKL